jgi:diphthamide biosynthesis protein 2
MCKSLTCGSSCEQIALQFPDELLHDSVRIFRALKDKIGDDQQLFVLADTSYGRLTPLLSSSPLSHVSPSCCVDEVAASHVDADAMVHYGHACMSKYV